MARWSARTPALAAVVYVAAYLLLSYLGMVLSVRVVSVPALAVVALLTWLATLVLSLLLVLSVCRVKASVWSEAAWMVGMMVVFALARPDVLAIAGRWMGNPNRGREIAELLRATTSHQAIGNAALIMWAIFLGRLVSRVVREGKLLLPVAAVASVADILTVFFGVVHKVTQTAPEVVETFSAHAPVAAPPTVPLPILSSVGIGDFLFMAVFMSLLVRYSMNAAKATWATLAMMLVAAIPFLLWPALPGMPGLPFISVAVLATNWRYLRFTRDEKRAMAIASLLVVGMASWIIMRH